MEKNGIGELSTSIPIPNPNVSEEVSKLSILERNNKRWDKYKNWIKRVYVDQDKSLNQTIKLMESTHNFKASPRKWKMKIKDWGFKKNIPAREMSFMVRKAENRRREGKGTDFVRAGQKVSRDRLEIFQKRKVSDVVDVEIYHASKFSTVSFVGKSLLTILDTPPNISYHTPGTAEYDIELPDSIDDGSHLRDAQGSLDPMVGVELEVVISSPSSSKLQHKQMDAFESNLAYSTQEEALHEHRWAMEEWTNERDQYQREHDIKDLVENSLHQARQHQYSLRTGEAIRFFLRGLFLASLARNEHLSDEAWKKCFEELSSLFLSANTKRLQISPFFQEEFKSAKRNVWLNHVPTEKSFRLVWKDFLRLTDGSWTQNSQIVCESFIDSFPESGKDRWRCRLELVKELSHRNLGQKAHEHHALSFSECLEYRKAVRGTDFARVWPELLSECEFNPSFAYHIMVTASQHLITGWWTIGQELLIEMRGSLESLDYSRIPEKWVILFIKLFESCYGHVFFHEYRPRAEWYLSQAANITQKSLLKDGKYGTKISMLNSEWKRSWVNISNPHYHKSGLASLAVEQIRDINVRLGNVDGQGWRLLLVDSGDMAKSGINGDYAQDRNSDNGESDRGDAESWEYGVTYTESLSSCPSMNYSALFPPEDQSIEL